MPILRIKKILIPDISADITYSRFHPNAVILMTKIYNESRMSYI